jgi:hypothetical protein
MQSMKNSFCISHVHFLVSEIIQAVRLLQSEQPQSYKKNTTIMEMQIYLVFIFTWLLIMVPNEQKSSTLMHFFDDQGFQEKIFLFFFYVFCNCWNGGKKN